MLHKKYSGAKAPPYPAVLSSRSFQSSRSASQVAGFTSLNGYAYLVALRCFAAPKGVLVSFRKEVIQPQVPLRLPCYDLVPITRLAFGVALLAVRQTTSGALSFRGLTGGVYKAQEHIHRGVADPRLLAIPTSCRRVAACNPNWGRVCGICLISRFRAPLSRPL